MLRNTAASMILMNEVKSLLRNWIKYFSLQFVAVDRLLYN